MEGKFIKSLQQTQSLPFSKTLLGNPCYLSFPDVFEMCCSMRKLEKLVG